MSDNLRLGSTTGAWGSEKDDLWWSTGGTVSKTNTEHTGQIVGDILLLLFIAVIEVNEFVESFVHFVLVNIPFTIERQGNIFKFFTVKRLVDFSTVCS